MRSRALQGMKASELMFTDSRGRFDTKTAQTVATLTDKSIRNQRTKLLLKQLGDAIKDGVISLDCRVYRDSSIDVSQPGFGFRNVYLAIDQNKVSDKGDKYSELKGRESLILRFAYRYMAPDSGKKSEFKFIGLKVCEGGRVDRISGNSPETEGEFSRRYLISPGADSYYNISDFSIENNQALAESEPYLSQWIHKVGNSQQKLREVQLSIDEPAVGIETLVIDVFRY